VFINNRFLNLTERHAIVVVISSWK
jgi:hypothetical protein